MNYNIIKDKEKLLEFINWLPELNEDEKYYLCLFARNKYCKELTHIKSDKAQLKRFVSNKERMFDKISQLEIELGRYKQAQFKVPETALALYITFNPRNMFKATVNTMVKLAQSIRDKNVNMNPHQEAMSEIQKSKSRTCWVDFDIDDKGSNKILYEEHLKKIVYSNVGNAAEVKFLESRGGYHVLINPSTVEHQFKNSFYQNMTKIKKCDQSGDLMIPVPGTNQGGFIPTFI